MRRFTVGSIAAALTLAPEPAVADDTIDPPGEIVVVSFGPDDAAKYWVDQRIRGARLPPRTASPDHLLQRVVAKLPGAISYVPAGTLLPGVRALTIDGRRAGEPGYPL